MTKFVNDLNETGISFEEVSDIYSVYSKLLNKAFDLNLDFSKILAEEEVLNIAKKVKEGQSIKDSFKEMINKSSAAKEVKVTLKNLL